LASRAIQKIKAVRRLYLEVRAVGIEPYIAADVNAPLLDFDPPITDQRLLETVNEHEEELIGLMFAWNGPGSIRSPEMLALLGEGCQQLGGALASEDL
jgi:hypothetical protein